MNALRFAGQPGHVESYFLRLNAPDRPRAAWIKLTVLAPLEGPPVIETWFVAFDGDRHWGRRERAPYVDPGTPLAANGYRLDLSAGHVGGRCGAFAFELDYAPEGAPLSIFPFQWMLSGGFPRSKLLTPVPSARFSGWLELEGERWPVEGWRGMQGHNWGREHAPAYAWGQCVFDEGTIVEGFSGKIRLGGRLSPWISALVVRRGEREYRWNAIVDLWRQEATVGGTRWTLSMRGGDGEARLRMDMAGRAAACLGYENPDGSVAYCINSKLADTLLEVRPRQGEPFHCQSSHGGALEFLRPEPIPGAEVI